MATPAHCIYCFETLASSFERRQPLKLSQIESSWSEYNSQRGRQPDGQNQEGTDLAGEEAEDGEEAAPDGDVYNIDMDDADEEDDESFTSRLRSRFPSHLTLPSPSSGSGSCSGSSSSSTPLSASAASSIRDSRSPADSKSSSRSSFFSPLRRSPRQASSPLRKEEHHPLFVTWSTTSRNGGSRSLRGCIGTFEPQELSQGLRSYALTSAFQDTRFTPITLPELPTLSCSVTLLTDFTSAPTPLSWTLGTHGIRISFTHNSRRYGATYLPDVPVEQGWSKEETMVSLMRKAGWSGRSKDWRLVGDLKVVRYRGRRVTVGWEEWRGWREWVDGRRR